MPNTSVSLQITKDGVRPSGQRVLVYCSTEHAKLLDSPNVLVRSGPNQSGLFIVRDRNGMFVRRSLDANMGIGLNCYLTGKVYTRRRLPVISGGQFDYSEEAFDPNSGRYKAYGIYASATSKRASKTFFTEEEHLDNATRVPNKTQPSKKVVKKSTTQTARKQKPAKVIEQVATSLTPVQSGGPITISKGSVTIAVDNVADAVAILNGIN